MDNLFYRLLIFYSNGYYARYFVVYIFHRHRVYPFYLDLDSSAIRFSARELRLHFERWWRSDRAGENVSLRRIFTLSLFVHLRSNKCIYNYGLQIIANWTYELINWRGFCFVKSCWRNSIDFIRGFVAKVEFLLR